MDEPDKKHPGELVPDDELKRLNELKATGLIDSQHDPHLDEITELASTVFSMPITFIGVMDQHKEWLKSKCGIDDVYLPRKQTMCQNTIYNNKMLIVRDTLADEYYKNNYYVQNRPYIRFYAGAIIKGPLEGQPIGVFCLIDHKPRKFGRKKRLLLQHFTELVENHIQLLYRYQTALDHSFYMYYFDPVTGLPNNKLFEHHVAETLKKHVHTTAITIALGLQSYETLQHRLTSDDLTTMLKKLAERFQSKCRSFDSIGHEGEGRFLMFKSIEENDEKLIGQNIQSLLATLRQPVYINQEPLYLSFLVGVSIYPEDDTHVEGLLNKAKDAKQAHAGSSYGLYNFYNPQHREKVNYYLHLQNRLYEALKDDKLQVALQPLVRLPEGRTYGYEALCRWHDEYYGAISPVDFIPLVQHMGEMRRLTLVMLNKVCGYLSGLDDKTEFIIALNVNYQTLNDHQFQNEFHNIVDKHNISPKQIELELTEDDLVNHHHDAQTLINQWRTHGVKFAIDDFGTGYSALSYLTRLPIDYVKIDKSFIGSINESAKEAELVRLIIFLNHELGYKTIAEGVETQDQAETLIKYGCDLAQGYYYGYPELIAPNSA